MTRNRRSRHAVLLAMLAGLVLLAASALQARPLVVWNATASTPVGLWRVLPAASRMHLRVGDYVLFWPDRRSAQMFARRGYLPRGVPLLKRVAAVAGQTVCEQDGEVSIDGRAIARALPVDGRGRRLAAWSGCGRLPNGEIFVLIPTVPASLDGRYFGPTPIRAVIGRATPLWLPAGQRR
ncbi:S26 family signal peptidase [Acidiphilium sp.]|uniref:S26 family signal peptidase n=1 Tax=Acidiphilium sp. TaxID=527 RepID=UPI00258EF8FA|nr:S26 family signal peptidase [Acidiphilium sp.]